MLQAALHLAETSGHIAESSPTLQNLRDAVCEVNAELGLIAKREAQIELVQPAGDTRSLDESSACLTLLEEAVAAVDGDGSEQA